MPLNRRQFLRRSLAALVAMGFGVGVDTNQLRLERVAVSIPNLPPQLEGLRIGAMSDLHLGPLVPVERVRRAAELLVGQRPDLVLVAGDFTAVEDPELAQRLIDEALEPVAGAFGVLGNWDSPLCTLPRHAARQQAVRILVNEGVSPVPGLWLAGLDSGLLGRPDLDRALAGAPPGTVRIVLVHEPDLADRVRPEHQVALQISGHTHGGQVRLPFVGPLFTPGLGQKYVAGLYQAPACQVYTTRGVGVSHLPIRLFCPPEVALITLCRGEVG